MPAAERPSLHGRGNHSRCLPTECPERARTDLPHRDGPTVTVHPHTIRQVEQALERAADDHDEGCDCGPCQVVAGTLTLTLSKDRAEGDTPTPSVQGTMHPEAKS